MPDLIIKCKGIPLIKFNPLEGIKKFRKGNMLFRSLKVYRDMAKQSQAIGDEYEAVLHINEATIIIPQANDGEGYIKKITNELMQTIHSKDFAFCMFGISPESDHFMFNEEQKREMLAFGDTALVITDACEFCKRVRKELINRGISLQDSHSGFIRYYDEKVDSLDIIAHLFNGMHNVAFQKRKKYAYQQEFRLLLPNNDPLVDCCELQIGDISGISEVISSRAVLNAVMHKTFEVQEYQ